LPLRRGQCVRDAQAGGSALGTFAFGKPFRFRRHAVPSILRICTQRQWRPQTTWFRKASRDHDSVVSMNHGTRTPSIATSSLGKTCVGLLVLLAASCSPTRSTVPSTTHLNGTVTEPNGQPAAYASVSAWLIGGTSEIVLTEADASGRFSIAYITSGRWGLYASGPGALAVAETVQVADGPAHLQLQAASAIRGLARLQGQTTHAGSIVSSFPSLSLGDTDSLGEYLVGWIPRGRWEAVYSHLGYRDTSVFFVVSAPAETVTVPGITLVPTVKPAREPGN
jgi:hypothetical protein